MGNFPPNPLVPAANSLPKTCYNVPYARSTGVGGAGQDAYSLLLEKADSSGECGNSLSAGVSADGTHRLFQNAAALAEGAEPAAGGGYYYCVMQCNLYDSVGGETQVVNLLPGNRPDPNAVFGGLREGPPETSGGEENHNVFSNAISADGSRIFWTDLNTDIVYVRENGIRTIPVSAGAARFWTATSDGHYAYYTEGEELLRFNVDGFEGSDKPEAQALAEAREVLAGPGAGVQGVVGVNETGEDGAYLYFVATGKLAPQAEKRTCETAQETTKSEEAERREEGQGELPLGRGCNLYLLHRGEQVKFIGALSKADDNSLSATFYTHGGDWRASSAVRTAEVSADGRGLVFESRVARSLTGYDNGFEAEIFAYDADTERISCASCDPGGAPPEDIPAQLTNGTFLPVSDNNTFMRRWISADGNQVFFDTVRPLSPRDTNGVQDVYEWEREGTGSCSPQTPARLDGGCISLLSSGSGTDWSWLIDTGAGGQDAFMVTRAQLVPEDQNEKMDLYDVRVRGGFRKAELACTGTGCQGVPPAQPIFATPSSVTFEGVGNFEPARPISAKPKPKSAKCKRGYVKKHGKCVKVKAHGMRKTVKRQKRGIK